MTYTLVLYHFESCPFCQKVRRVIHDLGLTITMKDIRLDKEAERELIQVGGKGQVPCLFINGAPLYESSDIITWLKENQHDIK